MSFNKVQRKDNVIFIRQNIRLGRFQPTNELMVTFLLFNVL